jgi:hypothetical protein
MRPGELLDGSRISTGRNPVSPAKRTLARASSPLLRQPGPLRAFYRRIRARRGHHVAVVAAHKTIRPRSGSIKRT